MDMITKASTSTMVIGCCTFLIPLLFNTAILAIIRKTVTMGQNMSDSLGFVQLTLSCSSFYDTACAVADLNLLNSEIGRLGLAISIITGLSNCQFIGIDPSLGPLMIGLTVPVGSPIAEAVQKKLECFDTFVLLPPSYIIADYCSNIGFPYFRMPIEDSLCLALLLNCDGIFYMLYLMAMVEAELMSQQTYTIMIFTNLLITMVTTPIVKHLYHPSRRYAGYKRQTILNSAVNSELRILACVYNQENVPSILNFLEATNPITKESFVCIYVLHLVELVGRATSLLIEHREQKKKQFTRANSRNSSDKIINAFHQFEQQNEGYTIGQCFTAISPFSSMDNDVSQIAMKKRTNLVTIPFSELDEHLYRTVNRNILQKPPCSVGILFDHKNSSGAAIDVSMSLHNIAMIYIGGADDREALAYSMRMADKPNLQLSVFRFTHIKPNQNAKKKDDELIGYLWDKIMNTENIVYKEEDVTDCADTASRIKCLEDSYDFIIVGRRHDSSSPILHGLDEWCVFKELGVIGDLFRFGNATVGVCRKIICRYTSTN
ncbi:cation/H(+) antiporter 15-like [Papaver somniferum]|uniref:cation/H(+) antiporter 15-like n=1 Tax=Papaver somniferum TaxID=3469 RepID=UPI000E6FDFDF|nr:cation/H(+) antiporter 15-like [Papaver somniferum]